MIAKYYRISHPTALMLALLVVTLLLLSCSNDNIAFNKGEQHYALGEYYQAATYYKKAYSRTSPKDKPKRALRAFKMGECYRHINYTQKALAAYQNAVRYKIQDSTALFQLARLQLKAGQYKQAAENFQLYLQKDPGNELARSGLLSAELAPQWKAAPNLYNI